MMVSDPTKPVMLCFFTCISENFGKVDLEKGSLRVHFLIY